MVSSAAKSRGLSRLFAVVIGAALFSLAIGWRPIENGLTVERHDDLQTKSATTDSGSLPPQSSLATVVLEEDGLIAGIPRRYDQYLREKSRISNATQIVVEVGTNLAPDFLRMAKWSSSFFIGLEPIVFEKSKKICRKIPHRCLMLPFAVGPKNYMAKMNKGFITKCSSLLPLQASDLKACNRKVETVDVPVITLDSLFEHVVPQGMQVKMLALDMQGFDLQGASSLRNKEHRDRIANFMLECQDLPVGDKDFISPGAGSCGEVVDCITKHWGFELDGCWPNQAKAEYNCGFSNPSNPHRDRTLRPAYNWNASSHDILYPKPCPAFFTEGTA